MKFGCVERPLNRLFYHYGLFVADHPYWFLVVPLIVAAGLAPGFFFFKKNTDVESLYVPLSAPSLEERGTVESLFPESASAEFDPLRAARVNLHGQVIVTSADDDGDVLSPSNRRAIRHLDAQIRNLVVRHAGTTYRYADLCARRDAECWTNVLLSLPPAGLRFPVHSIHGHVVSLTAILGGVTLTDAGVVTGAKAWRLFYPLQRTANASRAWQDRFLALIRRTSLDGLRLACFTANSLRDELGECARDVVPLFGIAFAVLTTFGVLTCWSRDNVVSKPWLGMLGVLSAVLAVVSSFGLLMYAGVDFVNIAFAGPFLVVGKVKAY